MKLSSFIHLGLYVGSSSAIAHERRHRDAKQAAVGREILISQAASATPISAMSRNSTSVSAKGEAVTKCYDVWNDGSIHDVSCSAGHEEVDAYDAAYWAQVVAFGLLAGAVLVG